MIFVIFLMCQVATSQNILEVYSFPTANITIQAIASTPVSFYPYQQPECKNLMVMEELIYTLTAQNYFVIHSKSLLTQIDSTYIATPSITDFSSDPQELLITLVDPVSHQVPFVYLNSNKSIKMVISTLVTTPQFLSTIQTTNQYVYLVDVALQQLLRLGRNDGIENQVKMLPPTGTGFAITPNGQNLVYWTETLNFYCYYLSTLNQKGSYNFSLTTTTTSTANMTFSSDSSLGIIETDNLYPIVIIDMATLLEVTSFYINDTINQVKFLNSSNSFVLVMGQSSFYLVDLSNNNSIYGFEKIASQAIAADGNNYAFVCLNSTITQKQIVFTRIAQTTEEDVQSQFYNQIPMTGAQAKIYQSINNSLAITNEVTNLIITFATSTPITIYFLGFLNYFTLTSLYFLLHFTLPEQVYKYLSIVYRYVQQNLLDMAGLDLELPSLSDEKVNQTKLIYFQVSSDVFSSLAISLGFFLGNILVIGIFYWLSRKLNKNNFFKKLMDEEIGEMISGQLINLMVSLVLPWLFLICATGTRNFPTKINNFFFIILFFSALFFPFYYLLWLVRERKEGMFTQQKKAPQHSQVPILKKTNSLKRQKGSSEKEKTSQPKKTKTKEQTLNNKKHHVNFQKPDEVRYQHQLKSKERRMTKIPLTTLVTFDIIQQYYICLANFLYPLLVLASDPLIFLVPILFFCTLGVLISFKKQNKRINSILLSLYPLLFHIFFIIIYMASSPETILTLELLCLGVYLLGAIHHILTVLVETVMFGYKMIKKICFRNKVKPNVSSVEKNIHKKRQFFIKRPKIEVQHSQIHAEVVRQSVASRFSGKVKKTHDISKNNKELKISKGTFKQQTK